MGKLIGSSEGEEPVPPSLSPGGNDPSDSYRVSGISRDYRPNPARVSPLAVKAMRETVPTVVNQHYVDIIQDEEMNSLLRELSAISARFSLLLPRTGLPHVPELLENSKEMMHLLFYLILQKLIEHFRSYLRDPKVFEDTVRMDIIRTSPDLLVRLAFDEAQQYALNKNGVGLRSDVLVMVLSILERIGNRVSNKLQELSRLTPTKWPQSLLHEIETGVYVPGVIPRKSLDVRARVSGLMAQGVGTAHQNSALKAPLPGATVQTLLEDALPEGQNVREVVEKLKELGVPVEEFLNSLGFDAVLQSMQFTIAEAQAFFFRTVLELLRFIIDLNTMTQSRKDSRRPTGKRITVVSSHVSLIHPDQLASPIFIIFRSMADQLGKLNDVQIGRLRGLYDLTVTHYRSSQQTVQLGMPGKLWRGLEVLFALVPPKNPYVDDRS